MVSPVIIRYTSPRFFSLSFLMCLTTGSTNLLNDKRHFELRRWRTGRCGGKSLFQSTKASSLIRGEMSSELGWKKSGGGGVAGSCLAFVARWQEKSSF